ncbi:MAG: glycosyltransferase family 1 protein [Pseudomonadota bacterium]|jgi:glycosyltransferase involved in cell wall biosynthesis|nr:glycosyltransferase family 1 protein [Pseudomonadota bacterium]
MLNSSGIGTCIKGWLPHILSELDLPKFTLLGHADEIRAFSWATSSNVTIRSFTAPIYSLREQLDWHRIPSNEFDLLWVPHLNIPYFSTCPILVTIHDLIFLRMAKLFGPPARLYAKLLLKRIAVRANAVFFVSDFTRREFFQLVGPTSQTSAVIHNGIDRAWFGEIENSLLPKKISDCPYILFVGNVKPHKNLPRLVNAFSQVRHKIPHRLVIVGKRDGFITADKAATRLAESLGNRVMFTGFLSDDCLRAVVANAKFLVFPSLYEGFGLPPLEALACGTPVLASRIPSVVEICGDMVTYFDPYNIDDLSDKLVQLATSPVQRPHTNSLEQYQWSHSAKQIVSLMKQLYE